MLEGEELEGGRREMNPFSWKSEEIFQKTIQNIQTNKCHTFWRGFYEIWNINRRKKG